MYGYSEEDFRRRLKAGRNTEKYVAQMLTDNGINIAVPEMEENLPTKMYTKYQEDLIANGMILEVKGRNFKFTSVEDFPYPDMFVESVSGFDQKDRKPDYYVNVSNTTGSLIALPVATTFDRWTQRTITDRARGITYPMYSADTGLWINGDEFLRRLHNGE